jgi:hypothetical protein
MAAAGDALASRSKAAKRTLRATARSGRDQVGMRLYRHGEVLLSGGVVDADVPTDTLAATAFVEGDEFGQSQRFLGASKLASAIVEFRPAQADEIKKIALHDLLTVDASLCRR